MTTEVINELQIKDIFKQAILEVVQEQRVLFSDLFMEAMEDIVLLEAMEEVDEDDIVSRDEIFQILEGKK